MKLSDTFDLSEDVVAREVGGEIMLLDLVSGTYLGLNPVGGRIWQLLEQGQSLAGICDTLLSEFDVERAELERDVLDLVEDLLAKNLAAPAA